MTKKKKRGSGARVVCTVRITPAVWRQVRIRAAQDGRTIQDVLADRLAEYATGKAVGS